MSIIHPSPHVSTVHVDLLVDPTEIAPSLAGLYGQVRLGPGVRLAISDPSVLAALGDACQRAAALLAARGEDENG